MADSQLLLRMREDDARFATYPEDQPLHEETCVECHRVMVWDADTNRWYFESDYQQDTPISAPERTQAGIYCRGCFENTEDDVVDVLGGAA